MAAISQKLVESHELAYRMRKQRCLPSTSLNGVPEGLQAPCKRCRHHSITCSFETDPLPGPDIQATPSQMAQLVVDLQRRVNLHESRIEELERQARNPNPGRMDTDVPNFEDVPIQATQHTLSPQMTTVSNTLAESHSMQFANHQATQSQNFSMDDIDLGPPIATLRSLGALSNDGGSPESSRIVTQDIERSNSWDPVSRGVLSDRDARKAVNIYFENCHPNAPFLSEKLRYSDHNLKFSSPLLFLAICCVGARFWESGDQSCFIQDLHPNFFELTSLLDHAISRLILQATPSDVTLDSIRVLMLYIQWMPCSLENSDKTLQRSQRQPKSRYNDISAYSILGVAIRYATFLGLDHTAIAPFKGPTASISEDDVARFRVWRNLLTCDCNLMLSSGLPATLDPVPAAEVGQLISSHPAAQLPGDLRITALVELVVIVNRVAKSSGDHSGRHLDAYCLKKVNMDLDEWERSWVARLGNTESQHNQLPFSSVRWYRLALNSAPLGPLLSSSNRTQTPPMQLWLLQSLETCLTAASQTLFSLSELGNEYVWKLDSQNTQSFPEGPFLVDRMAVRRLCYAVDSTWISHTFSVMFIVLCYVRGTIDDDLQIRTITPENLLQTCSPQPPRSTSVIIRLVRLALSIFEGVCQTPTFHPARDFQVIVKNAASLVLKEETADSRDNQVIDDAALQSLLDSINESGLEWPMNLFDSGTDFGIGWEV
ncbi:hypothetical protein DL98DRAFT_652429 [Cadophora sp. DSE1049]|nr:hypothetical protein DL98DRAFT_652429 [Cadophora sp. DSE1049]